MGSALETLGERWRGDGNFLDGGVRLRLGGRFSPNSSEEWRRRRETDLLLGRDSDLREVGVE